MKLNIFLLSAAAMVNAASGNNQVFLGSASNYVILAKTGISTVPTSAITGDIAVSPIAATAITGFSLVGHSSTTYSESSQVTGKAYAADYTSPTSSKLTTAVSDMETAYNDAAGRDTTCNFLNIGSGEIGGLTLTPGVYTFTSDVTINNGDVTFNANGDADAVFIIQTTGSVKQAFGTEVKLSGSAEAGNIFWQVAQDVIVEASSTMQGVLLVKKGVTIKTGATVLGRILAQTAVALQVPTITEEHPTDGSPSSAPSNQPSLRPSIC